jgi:hypothetical protein
MKQILTSFCLLVFALQVSAQKPDACFAIAYPISPDNTQSGSFNISIPNCSSGIYDSAQWTLLVNTSGNCNGTWNVKSIKSFGNSSSNSNFTTTLNSKGSYGIELKVKNSATGVWDTMRRTCLFECFAKLPFTISADSNMGCSPLFTMFSVPNYIASDSLFLWNFGDTIGSITSTMNHSINHHYSSLIDTCFTVTCIALRKSSNGFVKRDTVVSNKFVQIGHSIHPSLSFSNQVICLQNKVACLTIYPIVPGVSLPISSSNLPLKTGEIYFVKHATTQKVFSSNNIISQQVCFDELGIYDAVFKFCNGNCCDSVQIDSAIIVNGIKSNFIDSVWCNSSGVLSANSCTFIPKINITNVTTTATSVQFKISGASFNGGDSIITNIFWPLGSTNLPKTPQKVTYTFGAPGIYSVSMIVENIGQLCKNDTVKKEIIISNNTAIINTFISNFTKLKPASFSFDGLLTTSLSNRYPTYVKWSAGDTKYSNRNIVNNSPSDTSKTYDKNIGGGLLSKYNHTYDSCGIFTLKLVVGNSSKTCMDSTSFPLTVVEFIPQVSLVQNIGCNNCFTIYNQTTSCPSGIEELDSTYIDWGDGTHQGERNNWNSISHCTNGNSIITIKMFDTLKLAVKTITLNYESAQVTASFKTSTDSIISVGSVVNFLNTTSGTPLLQNYCWNSGLGLCSTNISGCNASGIGNWYGNTFNNIGYYYVKMIASNSNCADTVCKIIHVQNPTACFTLKDDTIGCSQKDTIFNCSMGGANKMIIEYYNVATSLSIIKSFTKTFPAKIELPFLSAGNYLVKLIYFDTITWQADTAFANLVVNGVTYSLSTALPSVCKNELVCFALNTNSSIAPIITYSDSLPFSLNYNVSGSYNFCHRFSKNDTAITQVYVSSGATCSHTYLDTIIIDKPIADFSWSPSGSQCLSKNVAFTDLSTSNFYPINAASYQWNFYNQTGSLINSSNLINPQITFYPDDTISATLIIASTHGCLDLPFCKKQFVQTNFTFLMVII